MTAATTTTHETRPTAASANTSQAGAAAKTTPGSDAKLSTDGAGPIAFYDGQAGRQYDTGNGATGTRGQQLTMTEIPQDRKASIRAAVTRAKAMVPTAVARCQAAVGTADASVEKAFKLPAVGDGDRKKAIDKVVENYGKVASALAGDLGFEGEDSPAENGTITLAYVYTGFIGLFDGAIHICFPGWNQIGAEKQATTIIHELTHQKCGTDDNAYIHESGKWARMSTKDAVNNAASYEYPILF